MILLSFGTAREDLRFCTVDDHFDSDHSDIRIVLAKRDSAGAYIYRRQRQRCQAGRFKPKLSYIIFTAAAPRRTGRMLYAGRLNGKPVVLSTRFPAVTALSSAVSRRRRTGNMLGALGLLTQRLQQRLTGVGESLPGRTWHPASFNALTIDYFRPERKIRTTLSSKGGMGQ